MLRADLQIRGMVNQFFTRYINCPVYWPNFQSIPLIKLDEEELAILKSSATKIVRCPSLIMTNAQGCNSLQELWEEDFDVGVGTHYTSSNHFGSQLDTAFLHFVETSVT